MWEELMYPLQVQEDELRPLIGKIQKLEQDGWSAAKHPRQVTQSPNGHKRRCVGCLKALQDFMVVDSGFAINVLHFGSLPEDLHVESMQVRGIGLGKVGPDFGVEEDG